MAEAGGSMGPLHLPKRKIKEAYESAARPKVGAKPEGSADRPREVASRSREDREEARRCSADAEDDPTAPWDIRGPPGPGSGGPATWRGQRFRHNTGRWANPGGRHKDKFRVYYRKQRDGLKGKELAYWHPLAKNGHWAEDAWRQGLLSPYEEKQMLEEDELAWLKWD